MEKKMYLKLLDIMLSDKSFRITNTFREQIKIKNYLYDTWFRIVSINYDGTVDIVGNFHTLFRNTSIENIVLPK